MAYGQEPEHAATLNDIHRPPISVALCLLAGAESLETSGLSFQATAQCLETVAVDLLLFSKAWRLSRVPSKLSPLTFFFWSRLPGFRGFLGGCCREPVALDP
jgi:hypothetical protein